MEAEWLPILVTEDTNMILVNFFKKQRISRETKLANFAQNEEGSVTILTIFMIMMMVLIGGIQLDFMRHEMERSRLQSVADRAVLAAADLDQEMNADAVVSEYFAKSGMSDYLSSVSVDEGLNFRTVRVDAGYDMKTQFVGRFGTPTLNVPAVSQAEEHVENVEISLVLDISGSMRDNSRLVEMQDAANIFLDTVLKDGNESLISVSLVPYSEQVNAGPGILDRMNVWRDHSYSDCIEFDNTDFNSAALSPTTARRQMQHFQWNFDGYNNARNDTVCPRYSYERITPMSSDRAALKYQVNQLTPRAGTAIYLGMKWGVSLLDPDFRTINDGLIDAGQVDAKFSGRPFNYEKEDVLKTVVLMTDGENSSSKRIASYYYDHDSEIVHWNNYNLKWYLRNYVSSWKRSSFYWQKYDVTLGNQLLHNICERAKEKNIVIWTIGFEVTDTGASVMKNCASSPSHFFRVEGVELTEAFRAIARQINQLRLTQ